MLKESKVPFETIKVNITVIPWHMSHLYLIICATLLEVASGRCKCQEPQIYKDLNVLH